MKEVRIQCKKLLIRDGYGKFSLVERIISTEKLHTEKPLVIYVELLELLGNQASRLNRNSFYTWLRRWRKRNADNTSFSAQKENGWKDYHPPSLSALSEGNDAVSIEFIKPK